MHRPSKPRPLTAALLCGCLLPACLPGTSSYESSRDSLRQWIEVERTLGREWTDWQTEKELLADRIALFREEKARLLEEKAEAEASLKTVSEKRSALLEEQEALRNASRTVASRLDEMEEAVRQLYHRFPDPLKEETARLYDRLPEDPKSTRLSIAERVQAVVGILNFADKFNSGIQREVEVREIQGAPREVETLYFGLAGAFFSDHNGQHAGYGYPSGTEGWLWEERPELAGEVRRLLEVYQGTRQAAFSIIPVEEH